MYEHIEIHRDVCYVERDGARLELDVFRPVADEPLPVIMLVHGGGWCAGVRQDMEGHARNFAADGYLAISVSYRLAPWYMFPAACEDMLSALAWIREHASSYGGDPDRVGAYGGSAGAHLAAWLATEPGVRLTCCVAWSGPTDLRREPVTHAYRSVTLAFMGDCVHDAPEAYAQASPLLRMTPDMPPLLLVHGLEDVVVPPNHARWMAESAAEMGAPVEAVLLEGVGHTGGGDASSPLHEPGVQATNDFFARYLH